MRLVSQSYWAEAFAAPVRILIIIDFFFALLGRPKLWIGIVSRIVLIMVTAIIAHEIVRFGAAHIDNRIVRILLAPGLMLQAMTTREPDDSQREAAISALNEVMEIDKAADSGYSA